jgi:integrase
VIQNQRNVASYLLLRNGIYYFQVRLKKNDLRRNRLKSGLIRQSLKTGSYSEAVHKARILWFEYMMNSKIEDMNEQKAQRISDLYSRGKELHHIYSELDEHDYNQVEDFFASEFGTSGYAYKFDQEAFEYFSDFQQKHKNEDSVYSNSLITTKVNNQSDLTLEDAISRYLYECKEGMNPRALSTLTKYETELRFFKERIGNKSLSLITIKDLYLHKLSKTPRNINKIKELKDSDDNTYSYDMCLKIAEQKNLQLIKVQTVKVKAKVIQTFFQWCIDNDLIQDNFLKAFKEIKDLKIEKQSRSAFSLLDIKKMFDNEIFHNGLWLHKHPERHWGTLIALYTGARADEICQLNLNDIERDNETNILYFHFTDAGENQNLKTHKKRKTPVHKHLIELGFENFIKNQKRLKRQNIFNLKADKRGKFHRNLTQFFNENFFESVGIEKHGEERLAFCFHCFRHKRWSYFVGQVSGEVKLQIVGLCYAAKAVFCPCFCSFGCRA